MRKQILVLLVALAMTSIVPLVGAGNTATINVTLNPQTTININVNRSGVWTSNAALGTTDATATNYFNLTNDGNVAITVTATGNNTHDWLLADEPAHNAFVMDITGDHAMNLTVTHDAFAAMVPLHDGIGDTYINFGLKVYMPTTSSTAAEQHFAITFKATAE